MGKEAEIMTYDIFIVDGDVFDPDSERGCIKLTDITEHELSTLGPLVYRQGHLDLVIRRCDAKNATL